MANKPHIVFDLGQWWCGTRTQIIGAPKGSVHPSYPYTRSWQGPDAALRKMLRMQNPQHPMASAQLDTACATWLRNSGKMSAPA